MAKDPAKRREIHGFIIVAASVIVYIPVAGIINSFGIFAEKLNEEFCPFDCLQILGWLGALTFGLNKAFCWMVLELQKVLAPSLLFVIGVVMCSTSLFLAATTTRLHWLFLYYCVLYGFGSSLVMNTPYGLIEEIFPTSHKYHVTSTSIMNVGAPIGMLLVNPLVAYLDTIESHTWRDSMRIFSLIVLLTGLVCSLPMSRWNCLVGLTDINNGKRNGYEDLDNQSNDDDKGSTAKESDVKSGTSGTRSNTVQDGSHSTDNFQRTAESTSEKNSFVVLCGEQAVSNILFWTLGIFLLSVAIFIPKVHFIQYMHDLSIKPEVAAACMSYEGLAEAALSFLISILGDPISPYFMWMYALCSAVLAIASFFLVLSTRVIHVAIYCTIHGAVDGLLMTVIYPTLPLMVNGVRAKQLLWSLTLFVTGVGQVVGLPMAGLIYDDTQSYSLVFYIASGVFGLSSAAFLSIAARNRNNNVISAELSGESDQTVGQIDVKNSAAVGESEDLNSMVTNYNSMEETDGGGHTVSKRRENKGTSSLQQTETSASADVTIKGLVTYAGEHFVSMSLKDTESEDCCADWSARFDTFYIPLETDDSLVHCGLGPRTAEAGSKSLISVLADETAKTETSDGELCISLLANDKVDTSGPRNFVHFDQSHTIPDEPCRKYTSDMDGSFTDWPIRCDTVVYTSYFSKHSGRYDEKLGTIIKEYRDPSYKQKLYEADETTKYYVLVEPSKTLTIYDANYGRSTIMCTPEFMTETDQSQSK